MEMAASDDCEVFNEKVSLIFDPHRMDIPPPVIDTTLPPTNGATSIYSLSVELLLEIFAYLPLLSQYADSGFAFPWISISEVCRHWYLVAQECRELWSIIPVENLQWTQIALERSRPVAVSIKIDFQASKALDIAAVFLALTELGRIGEILIYDPDGENTSVVNDIMQIIATSPIPRLETLLIDVPDLDLSGSLFNSQAPSRLRDVQLFQLFTPPASVIFGPHLSTLEIVQCEVWRSRDDMAITISKLINLEELVLVGSLPHPQPVASNIWNTHLPRLKRLKVADYIYRLMPMIVFMSFPTDADVDLAFEVTELWESQLVTLIPLMGHLKTMFAWFFSRKDYHFRFRKFCINCHEADYILTVSDPVFLDPADGKVANDVTPPTVRLSFSYFLEKDPGNRAARRIIRRLLRMVQSFVHDSETLELLIHGPTHWSTIWFEAPGFGDTIKRVDLSKGCGVTVV
ncbi:hypothetical protein OF83DRAFT_269808 [Amylostereum chailletii]|nr:hypothetical protein OF83DRAFT_269808 [Amylostereum chailletii]